MDRYLTTNQVQQWSLAHKNLLLAHQLEPVAAPTRKVVKVCVLMESVTKRKARKTIVNEHTKSC